MTRAGETAPPNTLTPAQLDNSSTWIPWMFMGQSLGLIKISLVDLFDRANSSTLGPNWAVYGTGMDIVGGIARCKRINRGNLTARVEDRSQGVYVSQLATDTITGSAKNDAFDRSHADTEDNPRAQARSEEHTSELQSLKRLSYAVFCLKKKNNKIIEQSLHLKVHISKRKIEC